MPTSNMDICGRCAWHQYDSELNDWVCGNEYSEKFSLETPYDDTCEEWEER